MVPSGAFDKNEGDSILSGFGSSSGSSTDETSEQEELLDELSRQMAAHMLQEEDMEKVANYNKLKAARFQPNHVFQYQVNTCLKTNINFIDLKRFVLNYVCIVYME